MTHTPVAAGRQADPVDALRRELAELARSRALRRCYDCGKCTSVCPVNIGGALYSPRRLGQLALEDPGPALQSALWDCLTCGACREICPVGVDFPAFVRDARALLPGDAVARECSHGGALQTIQRLTAGSGRRQDRLRWVPEGAAWSRVGETLLFTGSAPYYDHYFDYLGATSLAAPTAALRILNRLGIAPVLLEQERSSGHDLLFAGDLEGFRRLAQHNAAAMRAAGVTRVVTTCAESYHVLALHYRRVVPGFSPDVEHFATFLERELAGRDVEFHAIPGRVTYHDPCRLGRMSGVIDAPRRLLSRIPGLELAEMRHHGAKALCCGTSAWVRCGATNKAIQLARLGEAVATDSAALATACPKCVIHLRCAQADLPAGPIKSLALADITEILAQSLTPEDTAT
ncbi:MAG: (Fe-S)-binding protein [Candidatus Methylomirabilia bacterium]